MKLYTELGGAGRVYLRHSELESLRRFLEKRMPFELRLKGQIIYMVDIKEEKVSFWEGYGWESRMSLAYLGAGGAISWFFLKVALILILGPYYDVLD